MTQGKPISRIHDQVEDFAVATLQLSNGTVVRLACSWRLNAGYDCVIDASFYGSKGGAAMRNLAGSYYELTADRFIATKQHRLCSPPDDWGGRAALEWAEHLASDRAYDPAAEQFVAVSQVIDLIYSNHSSASLKTS
jgi:predicted dehydrogenase